MTDIQQTPLYKVHLYNLMQFNSNSNVLATAYSK